MRFLLDTNVLSETARRSPEPRVVAWIRRYSPLDFAISVLTLGEIAKGVSLLPRGKRRISLEGWLAVDLPRQFEGRVLPIEGRVAHAWGRLDADGYRKGRLLPAVDGLLLATASAHELTFVTRNVRDCAGRGVDIFNPWEV